MFWRSQKAMLMQFRLTIQWDIVDVMDGQVMATKVNMKWIDYFAEIETRSQKSTDN